MSLGNHTAWIICVCYLFHTFFFLFVMPQRMGESVSIIFPCLWMSNLESHIHLFYQVYLAGSTDTLLQSSLMAIADIVSVFDTETSPTSDACTLLSDSMEKSWRNLVKPSWSCSTCLAHPRTGLEMRTVSFDCTVCIRSVFSFSSSSVKQQHYPLPHWASVYIINNTG